MKTEQDLHKEYNKLIEGRTNIIRWYNERGISDYQMNKAKTAFNSKVYALQAMHASYMKMNNSEAILNDLKNLIIK